MPANVLELTPMGRDVDVEFFTDHPDRQTHIRVAFRGENSREFKSLGLHADHRRRILLWKIPNAPGRIMKIPFLAFADEEIRDEDETLLPILHQVMMNAAKEHRMLGGGRK